jgi:3',5'-cyclic AMP phosphodiesterase CpdA
MHHPPIETGIRRMDEIALDGAGVDALARIVARHAQVKRVVCGHVHRDIHALWRKIPVSICPSAAYQARFTLSGKFEPAAEEPPAYLLHYWSGRDLATHTITVPF